MTDLGAMHECNYEKTKDGDLERRVKARAYQIWTEEGKPEGKNREHWIRAKAEVLAREP